MLARGTWFCSELNAMKITQIKINFPCPVEMPEDMGYRLNQLTNEICELYEKANPGRVMWPMSHGCEINWSQSDAAFLGEVPKPDAPPTGEPSYDDSVFCIGVSEREDYAAPKSSPQNK